MGLPIELRSDNRTKCGRWCKGWRGHWGLCGPRLGWNAQDQRDEWAQRLQRLRQGTDVVFMDPQPIAVAQDRFQHNAQAHRQARKARKAFLFQAGVLGDMAWKPPDSSKPPSWCFA